MNYKFIALIIMTLAIVSYIFYLQITNMRLSAKVREQEIVIASLDVTVTDAINKLDKATILQAANYKLCDERLTNINEINKIKEKQKKEISTDILTTENLVDKQTSNDSIAFINALLSRL